MALAHERGAKLSDRQIAEHVGVDQKTVLKYRAEMESSEEIPQIETRTVRRGDQEYEQDTTNVGAADHGAGGRHGGDGPQQDHRRPAPDKYRTSPRQARGKYRTSTVLAPCKYGPSAAFVHRPVTSSLNLFASRTCHNC